MQIIVLVQQIQVVAHYLHFVLELACIWAVHVVVAVVVDCSYYCRTDYYHCHHIGHCYHYNHCTLVHYGAVVDVAAVAAFVFVAAVASVFVEVAVVPVQILHHLNHQISNCIHHLRHHLMVDCQYHDTIMICY